jgi:hypothetical protein
MMLSPEEMNAQKKSLKIAKLDTNNVNQGAVGDCYLISAISSLAAKYPELISEKFIF